MNEDTLLPEIDYGKFRLSLARLEEQYANFCRPDISLPQLHQEAVAESVVRRFKLCYDCLWKVLRRYLVHRIGLADVPNGPKPIFRLAGQNSLFHAPVAQWLMYAQTRIDASDDYDGSKTQAVLDVAADFVGDAIDLYETMSRETWR